MTGLLFLFGLFLALGLFFLAASLLRLPTIGAAKAMLGTVKQEKQSGQNHRNLPDDGGGTAGKIHPDG